jgi:hypothetical protein
MQPVILSVFRLDARWQYPARITPFIIAATAEPLRRAPKGWTHPPI